MRLIDIAAVIALAASAMIVPRSAIAGCSEEKVVDIAIAPGSVCWVYRGSATVFVGEFGGGQKIEAHMRGQMSEYDPRSGGTITSIADRVPDVSGPNDFYTAGNDGRLSFFTPRGGIYRFSFSPCAMWGGDGTVEICAR